MANTANSALSTNFNVTPYYDDYDETKGYYRILYKPGFAVQARELTQMQTILQKQIDRFGRHIFTEGSIVIPGSFQLYSSNTRSSTGPLSYVKVKDVDDSNNLVDITKFNDVEVYGTTTGIKAFVNIVADGSDITPNTKTLYVDYLQVSNANSSIITFANDETLVSNVGNLKVVSANSTGFGSAFRITSGVVFSKGHFVWFPTQEVVLSRYNDTPTCKVGFKVLETIVTASADSSLLDPALEASNYSAPGADRFQLTAELQVREIDDNEDLPDFVTLFTIKDGIIQTINDRTEYNILRDEFAKRTFDESGDYYVSGLNIDMREHLQTATNGGVFTGAEGGNSALISVKVEAGTAYVKGYEIGTLVPTFLATEKSTAYSNVENQIASAFLGSYITVNEMVGHLPLDTGVSIDLYDTAQDRITNGTFTAAQTGNKIGTARVASIEYNTGTLGTADGRADLYLMDIRMLGTNNFSSIRSVYIDNATTADFGADIVLDPITNTAVLYEPFNAPLLYYTGSNYTRKVKDTAETSDTTYYYTATLPVTITSGSFSVSAPGSDSLPYTGTLSASSKREILLSLGTSQNVGTGITATSSGNTNLYGSNFNKLNVGDKLRFSGQNPTSANIYTVANIATSSILTVNKNLPVLAGNTVFKTYGAGDYIDLTTLGFDSGAARSVTANGTTLTVGLNESAISTSAVVSFRVAKTPAIEAKKTLRPSRYVQINCAAAGVTGPFNLGFSDVYKIRQIRKQSSSLFTSNTEGTLVTNQFVFDNGQKDTHYDFATITPISSLSSTDRLLVELDYFIPDYSQGKGYFTVDSYPIDDVNTSSTIITTAEIPVYKSSASGKTYDLRNQLDFRPVKTISAVDATDVASASVNPSTSSGFNYTGSGIALVAPSSQITYDYSYYLGRKDVVHVNKDKVFSITKGVPSAIPVTPQISDNEMALSVLNIAPYPSISPYFAKLIDRQDIATTSRWVAPVRQTMRDIGVMKDRITNLEYYTALSLLEKNALDLLVTDASGNDRFKNGIFVDTFTDHQLGATYNEDYRIVVDPEEKTIRPLYSMQSIDYDYLSGSGVRKTGDLVTLDYSEVQFANVLSATSTLNTEKSTYKFVGQLTLTPVEDVWIDTITLPPNVVTINDANIDGLEDAQQSGGVTTTWNAWQTRVTGYKVYRGEGANRVLVGTFASEAEANRAAQNARTRRDGVTIETVTQSNRTGTEYFTYADSDTASLGSKVVNTEVIPYIRAQTLMGSVIGLKPFATFKVFFDGIDMSAHTRPITEAEYNDIASVSSWTNALGATLTANADGELWFRLNLPNSDNLRFTVGQKQVLVTDSLTASDTATSYATRSFFAQGVIQTKQDTILSTRQTDMRQRTVSQETSGSTFRTLPPLPPDNSRPPQRPQDPPPRPECCFVGSALVTMADGTKKPICEINVGDEVLSKTGVSSVVDVIITKLENRELYGFAGHEPFATEDHPFLTNKGWTAYKIGEYHEHLVRQNVQNINWDPMTNEETILHTSGFVPISEIVTASDDPELDVYALTLDNRADNTYWVEDFLTHNKNNACLAYVLPIKAPDDQEGIFLTAVEIFCAQKHPTLGIWCEVRELDSGGGITLNQVPFSEKWFKNAQVPISTDGRTNGLKVTFDAPLFLYSNKSYAFIIHPEAANPNYYFWISRIGERDVNTGQQVTSRAYNGTTFTTNNDTIWTLQDQIDLTCIWYRASFIPSGQFEIGNKPKEKIYIKDIVGSIEGFGEPISSGDRITLSGYAGPTIAANDFIVGNTSSINARVLNISSGTYSMSNIRYTAGESVLVRYGSNAAVKGNATIASIETGKGFLEYYKEGANATYVILNSSNGKFTANDSIFDISDEGSATIASIGNFRYSVFDFEPAIINFAEATQTFELAAYSNTGTAQSYVPIDSSENYEFTTEMAVFSRSNEIASLSSARTNKVRVNMRTSTNYLSPVFDLGKTQSIIVDNLINANTTNENARSGGQLFNKYISKIVTLAEGQDAEDLKVYLTSYRPPGTDIKVWMKILNGEDSDTMAQKSWIELEKSFGGDILYSSLVDKQDFREYTFSIPTSMMTGTLGQVRYTNSQGIVFTGFKSFQIKIGLLGTNSAIVPRVADLRTLALQI